MFTSLDRTFIAGSDRVAVCLLLSAHRAVIFVIAQLSCFCWNVAVADIPSLKVGLDDILKAINSQKRVKAAGPDGIHSDAFVYGCLWLNV